MKVVATSRTKQGTGASRRLRRAGHVPGIVYGAGQDPQPITLNHNDLWHTMAQEKFYSSALDLELDGKSEQVLIRTFQKHPFKPQVLHVDFQRIDPKVPVVVKVPLHFSGHVESPAVKKFSGQVTFVANQVEVTCMADKLPEFIPVDCSVLDVHKRAIHISDLNLPEGVTVPTTQKQDLSVATVKIKNAAAKISGEEA